MRKTLAGIGALSLTALSLAFCSNDTTNGGTPDLAASSPDLSATDNADLSATADLATAPDLGPIADMTTPAVAPTEFTVLRIGTGTAVLTNDATAGFLERRKLADGALVGQALALPTAVAGANRQLTFSGVGSVEGQLSRSVDGKYLVVAGYAANPGTTNVSSSASATTNRVIGRITAANAIDTTTAFNAFSGAGVRGVASTDGADLWVSSDAGVGYTKFGTTTAPTILSALNFRALDIFKQNNVNQLFASGNATGTIGISTVGAGTPTTAGATVTMLSGFTTTNSVSAYGFVGFDRDNNGSIDQLYVADDTNGAKGGVQRWKLVGTTWTYEGSITLAANVGARAVAGYVANNTVTLVATSSEALLPRVFQISDAGGATTAATTKALITAAANTTYRGIALAPQ